MLKTKILTSKIINIFKALTNRLLLKSIILFRLLIGSFVISICFSCNTQANKNNNTSSIKYKYASMKDGVLHLDLNEARKHPEELKLSEICDSLIYVPLETTNASLIGNIINDIKIDGEDIFIRAGWRLLHFNKTGKFINQIGKTGRGPGEYVCGGFCIDKVKQRIFAIATYRHKILCFDYDGILLSDTLKIQPDQTNIHFNDSLNMFYFGYGYDLLCTDEMNKHSYNIYTSVNLNTNKVQIHKSKYFPNEYGDKRAKFYVNYEGNIYYLYNNHFRYQEFSNDTLFEVDNGKSVAKLILNNKDFKPRIKFELFNELAQKIIKCKGNKYEAFTINDLSKEYNYVKGETVRYLFIGNNEQYIYDKYKQRLVCYDELSSKQRKTIKNDFDACFDLKSTSFFDRNTIIYTLSPEDFLAKSLDARMEMNRSNINHLINNKKHITEESNPILIVAVLKK